MTRPRLPGAQPIAPAPVHSIDTPSGAMTHIPTPIELYAEAFEAAGALDKLEGFASHFGADFHGLPRNAERITLVKQPWSVPATQAYLDSDVLVPLRAGESVAWSLA